MPRWIHNMLMGAAYMVGHRNPLVNEILERSDADAIRLDWDAVIDPPDYNWKPVTITHFQLQTEDYDDDDDTEG